MLLALLPNVAYKIGVSSERSPGARRTEGSIIMPCMGR